MGDASSISAQKTTIYVINVIYMNPSSRRASSDIISM
ncbi:MAG: hypothetical protein ACI9ZD_001642, partial [Paracoccaceae bacterium]